MYTMMGERVVKTAPDPPGTPRIRLAFFGAWFVDLIATLGFFLVPYASELNPVTVFLHGLFGLYGVVLAALVYAVLVVVIGHLLSNPIDAGFVFVVAALYAFFASNNVVLLVSGEALFEMVLHR